MENKNLNQIKQNNDLLVQEACRLIKFQRLKLKIDQEWLANKTGIKQSRISLIENGQVNDLSVNQLFLLFEILEIDIAKLFKKYNNINLTKNKGVNNLGDHVKIENNKKAKSKKMKHALDKAIDTIVENNKLIKSFVEKLSFKNI